MASSISGATSSNYVAEEDHRAKSKSEKIQELVQKMKAGNLSKSELFAQLSQLQRQTRNEEEDGSTKQLRSPGPMSPRHQDGAGKPSSGKTSASSAERRAMIQRLFDERRQREKLRKQEQHQQQQAMLSSSSSSSAAGGSDQQQEYSSASEHDGFESEEARQQILMEEKRRLEATRLLRQKQQEFLLRQNEMRKKRPSSAPRTRNAISPGSAPGGGGGALSPTSSLFDFRNESQSVMSGGERSRSYENRLRRLHDELVAKQMEECTFKPKINPLPEEYGVLRSEQQDLSFHQRVEMWKQRKVEEAERKRRELEQQELEGCTFQPKINRNARPSTPEPIMSMSRRIAGEEDAYYEQTIRPQEIYEEEYLTASPSQAHERLYQQSKVNKRAILQAQAKRKEEEELKKECTFKPKLLNSNMYAVRSRYMSPASNKGKSEPGNGSGVGAKSRPSSAPRQRVSHTQQNGGSTPKRKPAQYDENCTFTPQTNPIHPSMEAAQVYLSNDIFTRLTQSRDALYRNMNKNNENQDLSNNEPRYDQHDELGNRIIDASTFLNTMDGKASNGKRPSSAPRSRPSSHDNNNDPVRKEMSAEEARERRRQFDAFLARQRQQENRKARKVAQIAKQIQPAHTPKLCKKSMEIAKQNTKGSFLQRVAKGALQKEHKTVRLKSQVVDPECTFKPKINSVSQRRPGRSTVEMSRGDSLRKETNARLMKLRVEQEELEELTFQPELNNKKGAESRLKILSEPETYVRRLQHKNTLTSHKQTKAAQEQEMKELQECTFKPQIHDAPSYVKRIARSLALAKPAREAQAAAERQNQRPEWR